MEVIHGFTKPLQALCMFIHPVLLSVITQLWNLGCHDSSSNHGLPALSSEPFLKSLVFSTKPSALMIRPRCTKNFIWRTSEHIFGLMGPIWLCPHRRLCMGLQSMTNNCIRKLGFWMPVLVSCIFKRLQWQ